MLYTKKIKKNFNGGARVKNDSKNKGKKKIVKKTKTTKSSKKSPSSVLKTELSNTEKELLNLISPIKSTHKASDKQISTIVKGLEKIKKLLKEVCPLVHNDNIKSQHCIDNTLLEIESAFQHVDPNSNVSPESRDFIIFIQEPKFGLNNDFPLSNDYRFLRGGSQNNIQKNYLVPKDIVGCQGDVNGCNGQRLVYDSQGVVGCNKPFGVPSQGGQAFVYPKFINSQ